MTTHKGACHCGRVTFELDAEVKTVVECNCSICRLKGALWQRASESQLRLLTGEADLALYQFNTKTAKHYFCRHCGISPLSRPRIDPGIWVVNVRCIDGLDVKNLKIIPFDGVHWEQTVEAMRNARNP